MPARATAKRQPQLEAGPVSSIPVAISHLPSGGCTTKDASGLSVEKLPRTKLALAFCAQVPS